MNVEEPSTSSPFYLRFWGVRGSIPTPSSTHLGVGGNTACMQVVVPRHEAGAQQSLIFDSGTGIRALGRAILQGQDHLPGSPIHIFFTHFHWDHVQGLPYFLPLFQPTTDVVFHSAHPPEVLRSILAAQMQAPWFPVLFENLPGRMHFEQIGAEPRRFGSVTVEAFPLHHPQGSVGYRIAHPRRTAVYATDHEHGHEPAQQTLISMAREADLLIYDAQYTPEEYTTRRGWGHSTWLEATRTAREADARQLVLFHHDPDRPDDAVRRIEDQARQEFTPTVAACEGMLI